MMACGYFFSHGFVIGLNLRKSSEVSSRIFHHQEIIIELKLQIYFILILYTVNLKLTPLGSTGTSNLIFVCLKVETETSADRLPLLV